MPQWVGLHQLGTCRRGSCRDQKHPAISHRSAGSGLRGSLLCRGGRWQGSGLCDHSQPDWRSPRSGGRSVQGLHTLPRAWAWGLLRIMPPAKMPTGVREGGGWGPQTSICQEGLPGHVPGQWMAERGWGAVSGLLRWDTSCSPTSGEPHRSHVPPPHWPRFQEEVTVSWGWNRDRRALLAGGRFWNKFWSMMHTADLLLSGDKPMREAGPGEVAGP